VGISLRELGGQVPGGPKAGVDDVTVLVLTVSDETLVSLNCILIKQSDGCRPMKDVVGDVEDIPEGYPALDISLTGISIEMCFCNQDLCNGQYVS